MDEEPNVENNENESNVENEENIENNEESVDDTVNESTANNEDNVEDTANESNVTNEVESDEKSGNWFSKQSTPVKVILGIVAVCCIGLILLVVAGMLTPGGIHWGFDTNSGDNFTGETTVQGVKFSLPEGFNLSQSETTSAYFKIYMYSDGTNNIGISVYPFSSKAEILSTLKENPEFTNIKENVPMGGYTGTTAEFSSGTTTNVKVFVFEKEGKVFLIELSDRLNFDEYVPKIIG
ncbi:MAG: hypothetical protein FWE58_05170 [Methanobrevibacter sp.]|nr:hypothetical protein [Methanobrevibacter sp.]